MVIFRFVFGFTVLCFEEGGRGWGRNRDLDLGVLSFRYLWDNWKVV